MSHFQPAHLSAACNFRKQSTYTAVFNLPKGLNITTLSAIQHWFLGSRPWDRAEIAGCLGPAPGKGEKETGWAEGEELRRSTTAWLTPMGSSGVSWVGWRCPGLDHTQETAPTSHWMLASPGGCVTQWKWLLCAWQGCPAGKENVWSFQT